MPKKGRWVFVPKPKWETLPASYYSIRKSNIYLSLFRRGVRDDVIHWCVEHDIEVPPRMRRARIEAWVLAARRIVERPDSLGRIRVRIGKLPAFDLDLSNGYQFSQAKDRNRSLSAKTGVASCVREKPTL